MFSCIIFGGAGFVGTHLAKSFLESGTFTHVHIADIRKSSLDGMQGITTSLTDVRDRIHIETIQQTPDWIFNFAAIHREPGHKPHEYFDTNINGAKNISSYAESLKCKNIFFTSSIAVYGPTHDPTDEAKLPSPITPYGGSKYPAELIHQIWLEKGNNRRLVITRPGVIYGPGDPGNILRMIHAIRKGYFFFPGSKKIHKSYAYIYGFIDSIHFMMERSERLLIYNYVETPTETIEEIAEIIKKHMHSRAPIISLSPTLLMPIANLLQKLKKGNNPIHPVRVKKAGTPTHIIPKTLMDLNFNFEYSFEKSLIHWMRISNGDFK